MEIYTTAQLKEHLNISRNDWERRKEDVLDWMKDFFDYDVYQEKRRIYYRIKEVKKEWEPVPRKYKSKEVKEFYKEQVDDYVGHRAITTGATIGRYVVKNNNKFEHTEGTAGRHCREVLKKDYLATEGAWCYYDNDLKTEAKPLDEKMNIRWKKILEETFGASDVDVQVKILNQIEEGILSQEEGAEMIFNVAKSKYKVAMGAFHEEYGFYPFYCPKWEEKEWK